MDVLTFIETFRYPAIFVAAIAEGPLTMVGSGFLLRLHLISIVPTFILLLLGDFVGDLFWYFVGLHGLDLFVRRFGKWFRINKEAIVHVKRLFRKHEDRILLFSKLTTGFGFAVVVLSVAGMSRVPIKKYIFYNLLGGFFWTTILLVAGYLFAHVYLLVGKALHVLFLFVLVTALVLGFYFFGRIMRKKVMNDEL